MEQASAPEPPHGNQPGGPFLEIDHPAVRGRERELRRLADAVRRVALATVTTLPPAEVTAQAAARLDAVADALAALVPDRPVPRYTPAAAAGARAPHTRVPFDVVHGMYNPIALPLRMRDDVVDGEPVVVGEGVFGTPYEGPPGLVHGAVIAACFDMVLSSASRLAGPGGPTTSLSARYRRPTRLHVPCRFEGRFAGSDAGRARTVGRLLQGDEVTVVVEGVFRELSPDAIDRLAAGGAGT